MKIAELVEILKTIITKNGINWAELEVTGIEQDSRQVKPGNIFVAIKGFTADGHDFIEKVIEKKPALIVAEEERPGIFGVNHLLVKDSRQALALLARTFYGNPTEKISVIGVTGTNGKTTVTHLVTSLLESFGYKTGLIGTIYNRIGDKILPVTNTTPDALSLQRLFAEMVKSEVSHVAMEVSSHALVQKRVLGIDFKTGVFTNLTQDHLDFHESMENYFNAKKELFKILAEQKALPGVINKDDFYGQRILKEVAHPFVTYGIKEQADITAKNVELTNSGTAFTLCYQEEEYPVKVKLLGLFNVYNILAAVGTLLTLGFSLPDIVKNLPLLNPVPGRFELIDEGQDFAVIVDYAHTPDGLENILKSARAITPGRVIAVFGCGGDRDKTKRPKMGKISATLADITIITSDNPRTEDPEAIINEIEKGFFDALPGKYLKEVDRKKAIKTALLLAKPGDTVVIAGKGHEDYQIIGTTKYPFDDRVVAREILRGERR
ncbi:UDP-N-acetylmuramoyl-L-alanyl-D-glutamate--2,6-diaminopimelate ligase [Carboxydothermus hydrogenoformans]|uniref:UDP-N-acetylmuramoyl-L-alanyl-D-glutamate--2,6-diaminopimelate ligase n=1 Tax=Carboxydothermus hydrogenoformans (strain ATCC BAA-161 / DSM 6008 / Z-2901) TaxID=246194 RepID=Q3AAE1_CARHZ|nr:UDP-N-acetylmuramoyl-L-alanyl-D-glutamate--2,6-diaminopimelate ligase [Carboxydothermus hydrogenoformans]ABB15729.1 UDP-N-acetylmuramoylalanyl-D-glutamyl-2, 6-diaminopimelate ligase [Carboxydothermus hydrogenoformans Z-2901]